MLSAAAAGSAPSPLVLLPAPPSPASTDTQYPQLPSVANLFSSRIGERRKAPVVSRCAQRAATDHHAFRGPKRAGSGERGGKKRRR